MQASAEDMAAAATAPCPRKDTEAGVRCCIVRASSRDNWDSSSSGDTLPPPALL